MKNKLQLIAAIMLSAILSTSFLSIAVAEDGSYGKLKSALNDVRALYRADKAEIIIDQLKMTKTENKAFWPVYNAYTNELKTVGNKMVKLISGYADNSTKMTDKYADKMINDYLEIEADKLNIMESYIPKFKKVMPATKVAKLYQIENKLRAVTDLEIAANVPMIK
jgi:hypothetical protein